MWRKAWWMLVLMVAMTTVAGAESETASDDGNSLDDPSEDLAGEAAASESTEAAATEAAATADSAAAGLFGPQLRNFLGALENVDDMLRSTIPSYDRFQCLERLMCSMATSQSEPAPSSSVPSQPGAPLQQGIIQDASAIQQGFPGLQQSPVFQQGLHNPLLQNPGLQSSAFQHPALQNPGFQSPGFQSPSLQNPSFQRPAFQPPPAQFLSQFQVPPSGQVGQGSFQSLQPFPGGTNFQSQFPNQRENPDTVAQNTVRREHGPPLLRRRPIRKRRPQRNGFFSFLSGLGKRKKRSVFDDLLGGFTSDRFLGLLDQMMTQYSFYPYSHAAFMGYTGSPDRCETLYPSCPSTPEEMIDVFNNIHKYYPGGVPFKDKLPWPLSFLLP